MGSEPSKHQKSSSRRKSTPRLPPMGRNGPPKQRTVSLPDVFNPTTVDYAMKGSGNNTPGRRPFRRQDSGGNQPIKDTTSIKPVPPTPKKNENTYVEHKGAKIVVGLYEYSSDTNGDLSFQKGERMTILREEGEWFFARSCSNKREGYIPSTYVASEKSLDSYDWYHGNITRNSAEKYLHAPGNILRTFLIRESKNSDGGKAFALSVLDEDEDKQRTVRHYRIRVLNDERGFYVETAKQFDTLDELVTNYQRGSSSTEFGKLSLSRPCAKARPSLKELSKDKWEICRGELDFEQKLGAGKFGEVHKGRWRNKLVAIKTLKEGAMDPEKFLVEADIMKQLRHRKLVALYAVCSTQQPFYIITELMNNGCLLDYLRNDRGQQILFPTLLDIAGQVADGMMYIESKQYIHRDLAARNILVGEMCQVKIGDFGLSMAAKDVGCIDKKESFPVKWTAPEAMRETRFTIKSDVWSFGILLYEIITYGEVPYPGKSNREALQFVEQGGRCPRTSNCPESLYDIMLSCWKANPTQRPTFEALYGLFEDYSIGDQSVQYQ